MSVNGRLSPFGGKSEVSWIQGVGELRHFAPARILLFTTHATLVEHSVASASHMPAMADQDRVRQNGSSLCG